MPPKFPLFSIAYIAASFHGHLYMVLFMEDNAVGCLITVTDVHMYVGGPYIHGLHMHKHPANSVPYSVEGFCVFQGISVVMQGFHGACVCECRQSQLRWAGKNSSWELRSLHLH